MNRNEKRSANYHELKKAGFTGKQASRLKDLAKHKVQFAVAVRIKTNNDLIEELEKNIGVKL